MKHNIILTILFGCIVAMMILTFVAGREAFSWFTNGFIVAVGIYFIVATICRRD